MSTLRPIILSLLILTLVAGGLPVSDSLARWSRRPSVSKSKGKHVRRRHSRAWWRRRRAWLKRRRALAAARRRQRPQVARDVRPPRREATPKLVETVTSLASRITDLAVVTDQKASTDSNVAATNGNVAAMNGNVAPALVSPNASLAVDALVTPRFDNQASFGRGSKRGRRSSLLMVSDDAAPRMAVDARVAEAVRPSVGRRVPYNLTLPGSWSSSAAGNAPAEMRFAIRTVDGQTAGTASLAPVRVTNFDVAPTPRMKSLAGVPLNVLRRTVIDRMAAEGGWVVNDTEREHEGRRIYVVFARTAKAGAGEQALTFYFTEVDGRVYSLATSTPAELAEPVASASEKIIATFRLSGDATMTAKGLR